LKRERRKSMKKRTYQLLLLVIIATKSCYALPLNQEVSPKATITDATEATYTTIANTSLPTVEKQESEVLTNTQTMTTTPTVAKSNPYVFKAEGGEIDFSIGDIFISFGEGDLTGINIATYLVSPKNLGAYESTRDALDYENLVTITKPPDTGQNIEIHTSVIRLETRDNLIITIHSGYYNDQPLDAEALRFYIERWGNEETSYVSNRLLKMIGSSGVLYSDGHTLRVNVIGGIRLENNEALELNKYPENVLDIATKKKGTEYIALGNIEPFEELKNGNGHNLILSFCGWGPNNNYSYYRYLILLKVIEN